MAIGKACGVLSWIFAVVAFICFGVTGIVYTTRWSSQQQAIDAYNSVAGAWPTVSTAFRARWATRGLQTTLTLGNGPADSAVLGFGVPTNNIPALVQVDGMVKPATANAVQFSGLLFAGSIAAVPYDASVNVRLTLSAGDGSGNLSLSIPAAFTYTYDKPGKDESCIGQTVDDGTCRVFYALTGLCVTLNPATTGSSGPVLGAGPSSTGPGCAPLPKLPSGAIVIPPRADSCGAPGLTTGLGIGQYTASSTQPSLVSLANVPVTVRAAGDPYISALAATEATGNYGASPASQRSVAIAMWAVVGAVVVLLLLLGCCPPTVWGSSCYRDRSDPPVLLQPDCCGGGRGIEGLRTEGLLACAMGALLVLAVILWFVIGSIAASSAVPQVCVEGLLCAGAVGGGGATKISYGCPKVSQLMSLGGTTKTALALQMGGLGVTGAGILGSTLIALVAKHGVSGMDGEGFIAMCVAFLVAPGIVVGPILYFAAAIYARLRADAVTGDVCSWLTARGYAATLCSAGDGLTTYLPAAAGLLAFIILMPLCGAPCIAACAKAVNDRNGDRWADAAAAGRERERAGARGRDGSAALRALRDSFRGDPPAAARYRAPVGGGRTGPAPAPTDSAAALRAASTRNLPRGTAATATAAFDADLHADNNIIRPQPQPIAGSFFRAPPPPPGVGSRAGQRRGSQQPPVGPPPANRYHLSPPPPPPLPGHLAVPVGASTRQLNGNGGAGDHFTGDDHGGYDAEEDLHASNLPAAFALADNRIKSSDATDAADAADTTASAGHSGAAAAGLGRSPSGHLRTISLRTHSRSAGAAAGAGSSRMLLSPSSRSPIRTATMRAADSPPAMGGAGGGAAGGLASSSSSGAILNPGLAFYASSSPRASLGKGRRATGQAGSAPASRMASANNALRSASGRGAAAVAAAAAAAAAAMSIPSGEGYGNGTGAAVYGAAAPGCGSAGGDGYHHDAVAADAEEPAPAGGADGDEYGYEGADRREASSTRNPMTPRY